jgi:hypothetical protein
MKAPVRSRSIGTKVTEEEYARLEAQAAERKQSLSEWSREAMLSAAESGTGRRVQKTYHGNTTSYVYDSLGFLVAEYAGSTMSKEYIPFGSQVIAVENASGTPCQTCYLNYEPGQCSVGDGPECGGDGPA